MAAGRLGDAHTTRGSGPCGALTILPTWAVCRSYRSERAGLSRHTYQRWFSILKARLLHFHLFPSCCQSALTARQRRRFPRGAGSIHAGRKVWTKTPPHPPATVTRECLTCALFQSGTFFHSVAAEFAAEVVFPELGKPDIPSVVLQRAADEVTIKPWTDAGDGGGG